MRTDQRQYREVQDKWCSGFSKVGGHFQRNRNCRRHDGIPHRDSAHEFRWEHRGALFEDVKYSEYTAGSYEFGAGGSTTMSWSMSSETWRQVVASVNPTSASSGTSNTLAERMRISPSGKIGIGATSPSEKLHVVGNLRVQGSTDCTLGNGAGGTNCSSDIRLKENIRPIENSLRKILTLSGVEFNWNERSNSPGKAEIGVIAQDVEKVCPTTVIQDPGTGYKKVDYAVLVSPLIQATRELHGICKAADTKAAKLETEFQAMKSENAILKQRLERVEKILGVR